MPRRGQTEGEILVYFLTRFLFTCFLPRSWNWSPALSPKARSRHLASRLSPNIQEILHRIFSFRFVPVKVDQKFFSSMSKVWERNTRTWCARFALCKSTDRPNATCMPQHQASATYLSEDTIGPQWYKKISKGSKEAASSRGSRDTNNNNIGPFSKRKNRYTH